MSTLQAIVLGIVQGITEFLPISSTAHLYLVPWLLGWPEHSLTLDIALHMGTLAAVTLVFWRDLIGLAAAGLRYGMRTQEGRLAWGVVAGTVPVAIAGLLFEDAVRTVLRSPFIMALGLAVVGVFLWAADRRSKRTKSLDQVRIVDVVYMGLFQCLALVPGVSRSGITMTAGLLRGLNRAAGARLSFLLSFPAILGSGLLEIRHLTAGDLNLAFWVGIATSAAVGFLVIRFLLAYLVRGTYTGFAVYRVFLAVVVIVVLKGSHLA